MQLKESIKNMSYQRLSRIDGLRGLAILGVIAIHCSAVSSQILGIKTNFIDLGKYGVELFFLISGFILCYVKNKTNYGTLKFFIKRFFRLAPLYYLIIASCYLIGFNNSLESTTIIKPLDFKNFLLHIFFIHGLFPNYLRSIFGVVWSLTPEFVFYLLFPLLFKFSKKFLIVSFFIFLIIANFKTNIAMLLFGKLTPTVDIWINHSPINNMFLFIFGMMVFKYSNFFETNKIVKFAGILGLILFILGGFGLLGKDVNKIAGMIFSDAYFGYILLSFPLLIYSKNLIITKLLENSFMTYLGKLSYSAFFIHYAIIMILNNYNVKFYYFVALFIVLLLTIIFSFFSYNFIEQSFIKLGDYLFNKMKKFAFVENAIIENKDKL